MGRCSTANVTRVLQRIEASSMIPEHAIGAILALLRLLLPIVSLRAATVNGSRFCCVVFHNDQRHHEKRNGILMRATVEKVCSVSVRAQSLHIALRPVFARS